MGKNFGLLYSNKNLIELMIMAALTLAGIFIIRQIHQASAASAGGQAHVVGSSSTNALSSADNSVIEALGASGAAPAAQNTNRTSLSVNGQPIGVPENGSVDQTLTNGSSTTTVNARSSTSSTTSQGGASNTNHSSVNVNVHSSSGDSQ